MFNSLFTLTGNVLKTAAIMVEIPCTIVNKVVEPVTDALDELLSDIEE